MRSGRDFGSFDSQYTPFKQTARDYLYPFLSFSVHNFCARTDGRTDRHFSKKFYFFLLIKNIYTCLYLSRLFFKFRPHSDLFSSGNGYENHLKNLFTSVLFTKRLLIQLSLNINVQYRTVP